MKAVKGKCKKKLKKKTKTVLIQFSLFIFYKPDCFTEIFPWKTTIHPDIFLGRALLADSVSPWMNTIASRDRFKPIRIGENSAANYNAW